MNFLDWYTDTVDIYRVTDVKDGSLTHKERNLIQSDVPCRIYQENTHTLSFTQTAAAVHNVSMLSCDNDIDIREGDELIVTRGGRLGHSIRSRCFAGSPNHYYEPFGAVIPGLAHQEVPLRSEERI